MPKLREGQKKQEFVQVKICPELYDEVFMEIKKNVNNFSWGVDTKISTVTISRILYKRLKEKGLF